MRDYSNFVEFRSTHVSSAIIVSPSTDSWYLADCCTSKSHICRVLKYVAASHEIYSSYVFDKSGISQNPVLGWLLRCNIPQVAVHASVLQHLTTSTPDVSSTVQPVSETTRLEMFIRWKSGTGLNLLHGAKFQRFISGKSVFLTSKFQIREFHAH